MLDFVFNVIFFFSELEARSALVFLAGVLFLLDEFFFLLALGVLFAFFFLIAEACLDSARAFRLVPAAGFGVRFFLLILLDDVVDSISMLYSSACSYCKNIARARDASASMSLCCLFLSRIDWRRGLSDGVVVDDL